MSESEETVEPASVGRARELLRSAVPLWAAGVGTIVLLLFAIQLLGTATEAAKPLLERSLDRILVGESSALGLSWLATYVLANGSVVAAIAISFLGTGITSVSETFLMLIGSRLGSAAIIVLVGVLDYLQSGPYLSLTEGTSLGILTFLVTFTIYLPVGLLGMGILRTFQSELVAATGVIALPVGWLGLFDPITVGITRMLGPAPTLVVSLVLLFGSLWLFDEVLERVETETLRAYVSKYFAGRWTAFGVGILITGATTSIAFSLGVIVPLYNREYVRRNEIVPYILGANIGTLLDTLVVAYVLDTSLGVAVVVLVMALATLLTLVALVEYAPYSAFVDAAQDRLLEERRYFVAFGLLLGGLPIALLLLPHAIM